MTRLYQIRDQDFGLAIYEADFAAEALAAFLADLVGVALLPNDYKVNDFGDGTASVLWGASSTGHMKRWQPEVRLSRHRFWRRSWLTKSPDFEPPRWEPLPE